MFLSKQLGGGKRDQRSCQFLISIRTYLKNLVDSSDIERSIISRQIDLPSNDIPGSKNNPSDPKMDDDLLHRSQRQQQRQNTPPPVLGPKNIDNKVKEGKKKRDKGEYQQDKRKTVGRRGRISEVSVY